MGGDDLFVLVLCVIFAVAAFAALKGSRGVPPPAAGDEPGREGRSDGGDRKAGS